MDNETKEAKQFAADVETMNAYFLKATDEVTEGTGNVFAFLASIGCIGEEHEATGFFYEIRAMEEYARMDAV